MENGRSRERPVVRDALIDREVSRVLARWTWLAAWISIALAHAQPAHAQSSIPAADEARARAFFQTGLGQYNLGRYAEALDSFTSGYHLAPRPAFLINMAQAHRALKQWPEAKALLEQFLRDAAPNDPNRPNVTVTLRELEEQIAAARREVAPPVATTIAAPVAVAPPPPPRKSRKGLVIGLVVGGVVLVAAGVALGVVLGTHDENPVPTMGRVSFP